MRLPALKMQPIPDSQARQRLRERRSGLNHATTQIGKKTGAGPQARARVRLFEL